MSREKTNQLIELVENGLLTWEQVARGALTYMSEDDVADMARSEELIGDEPEEVELDGNGLQFLETALWTMERDDEDVNDLPEDIKNQAQKDVDAFMEKAEAESLIDGRDTTTVAHDFLLTRNGHGAGFWDGDYPEHGDRLTEIAKEFGEFHI